VNIDVSVADVTQAGKVDRMERVVLYEPRRLVREGMAGCLGREGFTVDECATPDELLAALTGGASGAAIVSFDGGAPGALAVGTALARAGAHLQRFQVLAVASVLDQVTARRLRAFGVIEVASPEIGLDGLIERLRAPVSRCSRVGARDDTSDRPVHPHLTPRERQVVALVSSGLTANQIASELHISAKTVENHKQRVFRKLDVQSQSHAVSVALRLGLLPPARAAVYVGS
jgi:DNA-binding NarL/FixJ family response regulator